jgi:hypothetical protein
MACVNLTEDQMRTILDVHLVDIEAEVTRRLSRTAPPVQREAMGYDTGRCRSLIREVTMGMAWEEVEDDRVRMVACEIGGFETEGIDRIFAFVRLIPLICDVIEKWPPVPIPEGMEKELVPFTEVAEGMRRFHAMMNTLGPLNEEERRQVLPLALDIVSALTTLLPAGTDAGEAFKAVLGQRAGAEEVKTDVVASPAPTTGAVDSDRDAMRKAA